jgi:hypothetical protein
MAPAEGVVELVMAADEFIVAEDGAVATVARNTAGGLEAAFELAVRGGMQPSRVGGEVNPLARRVDNAVVLRSVGEATERFVHAAAAAWAQPAPPPRKPKWRRLFERDKTPREARFAALLVSREGDASAPSELHLKLFCDGGELYLDVDAASKRVTFVEKDPEYRPALMRALLPLVAD